MGRALAIGFLVVAALALPALGLAQPPQFFVYLPWVQQDAAHIGISHTGTDLFFRVVPDTVTVRPGTPVVWDNNTRVELFLEGVWNGARPPLVAAVIEPGGSFTAVFPSPGTLEWSVESFSILRGLRGSGTVTVAE